MATPRKPVRRTTSGKPAARNPAPKTAANKAAAPKRPAAPAAPVKKAVPGSKGGFTSFVRANEQAAKPKVAVDKNPLAYINIVKDIRATLGGKTIHILEVPWEEKQVALVYGATLMQRLSKYVYIGNTLPLPLEKWRSEDYSYNRWLEDQINQKAYPNKRPGSVFKPRDYQQVGIDAIRTAAENGRRGFVLADATGLGKSLTGLLGISAVAEEKGFTQAKKAKVLIICPKAVIPHWRNTMRSSGVKNIRLMVINYDQYKKLLVEPPTATAAKKTSTKNRHTATKGTPFISWDMIIADEVHKLKNISSQRSRGFEIIARYKAPADVAPFVLWMSATIGSSPLELSPIAPLIGQVAGEALTSQTWPEFLHRNKYHVEKRGSEWQWLSINGKRSVAEQQKTRELMREDVSRLGSLIFADDFPALRRKPEDIAGWPEQQTITLPVELTPNARADYDKLWTKFRKDMKLKPHGHDPKGVLVEMLRFSQKASLLRIPQTIDQIVEHLENGEQVAVSVRFIESLDMIKSGLRRLKIETSEISGRPGFNNEQERMDFQMGKTRVVLFTVEEGISLHASELFNGRRASSAPRVMLVHDARFSALSMTQIMGRTHRDGQNSICYFLYAEDTIEYKILDIMLTKMRNMNTLSGDTEEENVTQLVDAIV